MNDISPLIQSFWTKSGCQVEQRQEIGGGRGVFAQKEYKAGDVIAAEVGDPLSWLGETLLKWCIYNRNHCLIVCALPKFLCAAPSATGQVPHTACKCSAIEK